MKLNVNSAYKLAYLVAKDLTTKYPYFIGINPKELAKNGLILMHIETGGKFNADAYNKSSGSSGLMQIKPMTKKEVEVKYLKSKVAPDKYLFDAKYNAYLGLAYLGYQYKRYERNWKKAVLAYNQGNAGDKAQKSIEGSKYLSKYYALNNSINFNQLENSLAVNYATNDYEEFA